MMSPPPSDRDVSNSFTPPAAMLKNHSVISEHFVLQQVFPIQNLLSSSVPLAPRR